MLIEARPIAIRPAIFENIPELSAAQSTRHEGYSVPPYSSLNLSFYTKDDPEVVRKNRQRFFEFLGFSSDAVAQAYQVHGKAVIQVTEAGTYEHFDALITQTKDLLIGVSIADCTPVLLYDRGQKAVAAIHAGWKGTIGRIVEDTLQKMQHEFGTQAKDCYAYLGACIDECTFEVDADVADHFSEPFKRWDAEREKFLVDLKKANTRQLLDFGIPSTQIEVSPYSTVTHNEHFFSHRKEKGQTGRMMAVIGMHG